MSGTPIGENNQENLMSDCRQSINWEHIKKQWQQQIDIVKAEIGAIHVDTQVTLLGFKEEINNEMLSVKNSLCGKFPALNFRMNVMDQKIDQIRYKTEIQEKVSQKLEKTILGMRNEVTELYRQKSSTVATERRSPRIRTAKETYDCSLLQRLEISSTSAGARSACPNCAKIMLKKNLSNHITKNCKGIPERANCKYCGKNLSMLYLPKHIMGVCKKAPK